MAVVIASKQFMVVCNTPSKLGEEECVLMNQGWTYIGKIEAPMLNIFNHNPTTQTFIKCQNLIKMSKSY